MRGLIRRFKNAVRCLAANLPGWVFVWMPGEPDAAPVPDEVLYAEKWSLKGLSTAEKRKTLKSWVRKFVANDDVFPDVQDGSWLFFRSVSRKDYQAMFQAVVQAAKLALPTKCVLAVEDYTVQKKGLRNYLEKRRFMRRNRHLELQIQADCPVERKCLFVRVCMYSYILRHFSQCRPEVVVFFADMQSVEHLLSLHFRSRGTTTITLQHGLYVDYGHFDTVNSINYLHQPSEYFLSWGRNTSDLIRRYHPETKVVECGKPLIFAAEEAEGQFPTPHIAVLLDQRIFHEQNRDMLRIAVRYAAEKGLAVTVRLHPQLFQLRTQLFREFPELIERPHFADAEFVVGHTSTMIYEAIHLGRRVVRYRSDAPAIPLPSSCEFTSYEELLACLSSPMPKGLGESFFCAVGEKAIDNYRNFFRSLCLNLQTDPRSSPHSSSPS